MVIESKQEVMSMTHMALIDPAGRVTLPPQALEALGAQPARGVEVVIELTAASVMLKPRQSLNPITERIATMNLPVADWPELEREIEAGRLALPGHIEISHDRSTDH
jgi:hypothetical protein